MKTNFLRRCHCCCGVESSCRPSASVIFASKLLQSTFTSALVQLRVNTPDPEAVSLHCPLGVP